MASQDSSVYINIGPDTESDKVFTLKELAQECGDNFPVVVTIQPPEYELMYGNYLPPDEDVLFIKSTPIPFVRVKILPFVNEEEIAKMKGPEFVEARNKFTGKEFLLPLGYPGKVQLVQKHGRRNRLTSMSQVIETKPGFIQICQMVECESPIDGSNQTIQRDTILEITAVKTLPSGNVRYIECKTSDNKMYYLTEDCPVNGKALHRLSTIVEDTASLPETVLFEHIDPNDVLLSDDEEANDMLVLTDGPLAIRSVHRRSVYVAWLKVEEFCERRKLAVIPEEVWSNIHMKLLHFSSNGDRIKYMTKFGCHFEAKFIVDSLYKMLPAETGVVLLSEPRVDNIDDYETPVQAKLPRPEKVKLVDEDEEVLLPTHVKTKKESQFKEKIKAKFSKGHKLLYSDSSTTDTRSKEKRGSRNKTHELVQLPNKPDMSTPSHIQADASIVYSIPRSQHTNIWNKDVNVKETKPQQAVRPIIALPTLPKSNKFNESTSTLRKLVDISKITQHGQTKADFYEYTRDEVVECFKLCGLTTLATKCCDHNLDGAFFRNMCPTDLQKFFDLEQIDVLKVKNAIENGWRPILS